MTAARQQKDKTKKDSAPSEPRKVPVYLPTSSPPKRHPVFLIVTAVVAVLWIAVLAYLALQQIGAA